MAYTDFISAAIKKDIPAIKLDDTLRAAIEKMAEAGTSALMVAAGGEFVGIVTDMDVMKSISDNEDLDQTRVSKFMTACELITTKRTQQAPCVQLDETETVKMACGVMQLSGLHNILVTGKDDKPVGFVSTGDLLKLAIA
ncbi:MAG: CBS domain-containing protein [Deltaproteobacteria bacterium]|nr:CBS domain-containing protein [Deltaproteobacteria bacterium]